MKNHSFSFTRGGGELNHYYHFIFDFLWPCYDYLKNNNMLNNEDILLTFKDRNLHYFMDIISEFFDNPIKISKLNNLISFKRYPEIALKGFNPLNHCYIEKYNRISDARKSLDSFREYLLNRFNIVDKKEDQIVLIERGKGDGYRGNTRRDIHNHPQLKDAVAKYCQISGFKFSNVILENMTFRDQINLFNCSKVVIGQHGAGFANLVAADPANLIVVELAGENNPDHFHNFCHDFDFTYRRLKFSYHSENKLKKSLLVEINEVLGILNEYFSRTLY